MTHDQAVDDHGALWRALEAYLLTSSVKKTEGKEKPPMERTLLSLCQH